MMCDNCKTNPATYHYVMQTDAGIVKEVHLCGGCYSSSREKTNQTSAIDEIFSGFKSMFEPPKKRAERLACKSCNTTAEEFLNSGFVGCSECYSSLAAIVDPVIKKVQSGERHTGKRPSWSKPDKKTEHDRLTRELNAAVIREDYEKAAEISEKLKTLKERE